MEKEGIFNQEETILNHSRNVLAQAGEGAVKAADYAQMVNAYDDLLAQTRMLTKISDRLQRKIDQANHELSRTNHRLTQTIDDLMKARMGRKATTVVFAVALALFLVSEALIEPRIDQMLVTFGSLSTYLGYALKGMIALMIKPFEGITEKRLVERARKNAIKRREKEGLAAD
jgi:hypothetical protein